MGLSLLDLINIRRDLNASSALLRTQNTFVVITKTVTNYSPAIKDKYNTNVLEARVVNIGDEMESFKIPPWKKEVEVPAPHTSGRDAGSLFEID